MKWPNDVLAGPDGRKRKLAGVLVEGQLRGAEVVSLVAGVGVNVHAASFPDALAARATSLALLGAEGLDRSVLAARLVAEIASAAGRFEEDRLASFSADLAQARRAAGGEGRGCRRPGDGRGDRRRRGGCWCGSGEGICARSCRARWRWSPERAYFVISGGGRLGRGGRAKGSQAGVRFEYWRLVAMPLLGVRFWFHT